MRELATVGKEKNGRKRERSFCSFGLAIAVIVGSIVSSMNLRTDVLTKGSVRNVHQHEYDGKQIFKAHTILPILPIREPIGKQTSLCVLFMLR